MEYLVWPDGDYCEPPELEEMMLCCGKSDDFEIVEVHDETQLEYELYKVRTGRYPREELCY